MSASVRPLIPNNAQARGHAGGQNDAATYGRKMCGTRSGADARLRWGNLPSSFPVSHSGSLPPGIASTVWDGGRVGSAPAAFTVSVLVRRSSSGNKFLKKGGWGRGAPARGSVQVGAANGHDGGWGEGRGSEEESMRPDSRYLAAGARLHKRGWWWGGGGGCAQ